MVVYMRAELKSLTGTSVDLPSYRPEAEAFCIEVTAAVGTAEKTGADNFDFSVCSPEWLLSQLEEARIVSARRVLFMDGFNYETLEAFVRRKVEQVQGPDWPALVCQLRLWSDWEFAD